MTTENMTAEAAEELTQRINAQGVAFYESIRAAYHGRADEALGYQSWTAYVRDRYPVSWGKALAVSERRELVAAMAADGVSKAETAKALGVSRSAVQRDRRGSNEPLDGKRPKLAAVPPLPAEPPTAPLDKEVVAGNRALAKYTALAAEASDALTRGGRKIYGADRAAREQAIGTLGILIGNAVAALVALDHEGAYSIHDFILTDIDKGQANEN